MISIGLHPPQQRKPVATLNMAWVRTKTGGKKWLASNLINHTKLEINSAETKHEDQL
jgi:hypothetical protein